MEALNKTLPTPEVQVLPDSLAKLASLFSIYNNDTNKKEPVTLSPSQQEVFNAIVQRSHPRYHVMTVSQFGKSFTVALAVLIRAATTPEKWAIVAPTEKQARIIMGYVIEHAFDHPLIESQLIQTESKDRLKQERSKKRITFRRGGEIFILSADSKNKKAAGESLMGFGAANIVLDESCLISDDIYAKIFRMLGGHKNNFLLEIGNPFHRNHFLDSYRNERYKKIIVDWRKAVEEGRMQREFVDEMRDKAHFDVLYECKFPTEEAVDADGWHRLFYEDTITRAMRKTEVPVFGARVMGVDVNRGGDNYSAIAIRHSNHAEILEKFHSSNLNEVAAVVMKTATEKGVPDHDIYVDSTGVGGGLVDILHAKGWNVNGVNMSATAIRDDKYINRRAEAYILASEWLKKGNTLNYNNDWHQLEHITGQVRDSSGKWKIISKQELMAKGIQSPDIADAFMLTFCAGDLDDNVFFKVSKKVEVKRGRQPVYE